MPSRPARGRRQRVASKESAGCQPSLGRLPAHAPPPFPRGPQPPPATPLLPTFTTRRAVTSVKRMGLKWGCSVSLAGRKTHGTQGARPRLRVSGFGAGLSPLQFCAPRTARDEGPPLWAEAESCALLSGAPSPPASRFRSHTCSLFLLPELRLDPPPLYRQPAWP